MNALKNFMLVWCVMLLVVITISFALVFIYPFAFIFNNQGFRRSTEWRVKQVKTGFRKLEKSTVNMIQRFWSE